MSHNNLRVFSGRANLPLAERIVKCTSINQQVLGKLVVDSFPDSETSVRIEEDVRGRDVFIIQPTCPPVNQHLGELLVILDAFKRASPYRITVVMPYYGYARQDRKDQGRVPISAKMVADVLTAAGANRVLTMDLHAAQIQGFFDIPVDHLMAAPVFIRNIQVTRLFDKPVVFVAPDEGRVKSTLYYQKKMGGELAIVDKRRVNSTETEQANLIGASLEGKTVIMFDDMITTAGSITGAAKVCKEFGAAEIHVFATHGVFCGPAIQRLEEAPIDRVVITDSIPLPSEKHIAKIEVISVDNLLAEAIKAIHEDESISKLFD